MLLEMHKNKWHWIIENFYIKALKHIKTLGLRPSGISYDALCRLW